MLLADDCHNVKRPLALPRVRGEEARPLPLQYYDPHPRGQQLPSPRQPLVLAGECIVPGPAYSQILASAP